MYGQQGPCMLLAEPYRAAVLLKLSPTVRSGIQTAAASLTAERRARDAAVLQTLRRVASARFLTCADAAAVVRQLAGSPRNQIEAVVALWNALADRSNAACIVRLLSAQQLRVLMRRLGHYAVVKDLAMPNGCRFSLNVKGDPDQALAAKTLCKQAADAQRVWGEAIAQHKAERGFVAQPTIGNKVGRLPVARGAGKKGAASNAEDAQRVQEVAKLKAALARLPAFVDMPLTVLRNVAVDGEPFVGRANVEPQHLWADVSGSDAQTLAFDVARCVFQSCCTAVYVHTCSERQALRQSHECLPCLQRP